MKSSIWSPSKKQYICPKRENNGQNLIKIIKIKTNEDFLGVNYFVNDNVALVECGRMPLCVDHQVKIINYQRHVLV
jgi:hypothetical protein